MRRMPHRVVVEFTPTCNVLHAACTCPAGLVIHGKREFNHVGGVLFAIGDFIRRGLQNNPEPLTRTSLLSVWVVPWNQSVAAKLLDKVLIQRIRFGKEEIRTQLKIIKFDPRASQHHGLDEERFQELTKTLQDCLPSSLFFLFHDLQSNCAGVNDQSTSTLALDEKDQEDTPFTDNFDFATHSFKCIVDEHVSNMTVVDKEICGTKRPIRGQNKNQPWFDKWRTLLTVSNVSKASKPKLSHQRNWSLCSTLILRQRLCSMELKARRKLWPFLSKKWQKRVWLNVDKVGCLQSKKRLFITANVDRIITDRAANEEWGMEMKSPLSKTGMRVEDACKRKNVSREKLNDGTIRLTRNHDYYI